MYLKAAMPPSDFLQHPGPSANMYLSIFGSSAQDLADTAAFFVTLFLTCVQSSLLQRVGVKTAAVVSAVQALLIVVWPCWSGGFPAWPLRITFMALWTAGVIHSSYWHERDLREQVQLSAKLQTALQVAPGSICNHRVTVARFYCHFFLGSDPYPISRQCCCRAHTILVQQSPLKHDWGIDIAGHSGVQSPVSCRTGLE